MALFALWSIEVANGECCKDELCCKPPPDERGSRHKYSRPTSDDDSTDSNTGLIYGLVFGLGGLFLVVCVIVGVLISVSSRGDYHNRGAVYIDQTRPSGNFQDRADFNVAPSPAMVTPTSGTPQFTPAAYPEKDSEISVSMRDNDHMPMPQAKVPYVPYPLGEAGPQPASA